MICPECGGIVEENICSKCRYKVNKNYNTNNDKKKKSINSTFTIIQKLLVKRGKNKCAKK